MKEHIDTITDLMLGAAYADKRLEGKELAAIRSMAIKLLGSPALPQTTENRIKSFNPARFDVKTAARSIAKLTHEQKHKVLELVATVTDSDDELDLAEDAYLRKVAEGLGLGAEDLEGMTIEILEEDELEGFLDDVEDLLKKS
jgi:uncharacterized tellurite resistance protein B-like protein